MDIKHQKEMKRKDKAQFLDDENEQQQDIETYESKWIKW